MKPLKKYYRFVPHIQGFKAMRVYLIYSEDLEVLDMIDGRKGKPDFIHYEGLERIFEDLTTLSKSCYNRLRKGGYHESHSKI